MSNSSSIRVSGLFSFFPEYEPFSLYLINVSIIAGISNFNLEILSFFNSKRGMVFDKNGMVDPSKKMLTIPFRKYSFVVSIFWIFSSDHSLIVSICSSSHHLSLETSLESSGLLTTRITVVNRFRYSFEKPVKASSALKPFSFSLIRRSNWNFFRPSFSISFFNTSSVSLIEFK